MRHSPHRLQYVRVLFQKRSFDGWATEGFMNKIIWISTFIIGLTIQSSHAARADELQTVTSVDLTRYVGLWYEIARYPNSFEKNCNNATARYTASQDGTIKVVNSCIDTIKNKPTEAEGLAIVDDDVTHAKLKVSFLPSWLRWTGIGEGDYWVIQLGTNYEYSVVSEPNRQYLWILSRTPEIKPLVYKEILSRLEKQGFNTDKLENSRK